MVVFQTIPLPLTADPPSLEMFPPELDPELVIEVIEVVVSVAKEAFTVTNTSFDVRIFEHGAPNVDLQTI